MLFPSEITALPDVPETHRSFVNTWECDENQHLNVQFYARRFEEARHVFNLLAGDGRAVAPPRDRHLRFHAELHAGATTITRSAVIADGAFAGCVVHMLHHAETDVLSATALESPAAEGIEGHYAIPAAMAAKTLPRGIGGDPLSAVPVRDFTDAGGRPTNFSVIAPGDCDAGGDLTERALVGRFSDGAPHAWRASGIDTEWLLARKLGRVALEMKITRHARAQQGDVLALYSTLEPCGGKTMMLHHELVEPGSGKPVASGRVVALILDLVTRRPAELPASVVAQLRKVT